MDGVNRPELARLSDGSGDSQAGQQRDRDVERRHAEAQRSAAWHIHKPLVKRGGQLRQAWADALDVELLDEVHRDEVVTIVARKVQQAHEEAEAQDRADRQHDRDHERHGKPVRR